jgi:hypothetical protein
MHQMKRSLLIGLLAAGTVLGYGAGIFSTACHASHRRDALERHVAATCVEAALRARPPEVAADPGATLRPR